MVPTCSGSATRLQRIVDAGRALGFLGFVLAIAGCDGIDRPLGAISRPPSAATLAVSAPTQRDTIPDEYIVVLKPGPEEVRGLAKKLVDTAKGQLRFSYSSVMRGFSARIPSQALRGIRHHPFVEAVYPNRVVWLDDVQTSLTSWGLDRIDQTALPLNGSYSYASNGAGVSAYIIDSGIRSTHREFGGRVVSGFSAIADSIGTEDCHGHGTHVAGTVGGSSVGVAKAVTLIAVRVLACNGGGTEDGVIAGMDWVAAHRHLPAVANMSLGGGLSTLMDQAVANLTAAGVVVTVAAGNQAADACFFSPAAAPSAITVGATDQSDTQAIYSNYGGCLDLYAPGSNITSASIATDTSYRTASGTSMAAPHVAGAAALYLQANPLALPSTVASALVGAATRRAVSGIGKGSPNLLLFTGGPSSSPTPPTAVDQPPVASFSATCPRVRCTFDASTSTDDRGIVNYTWYFGDDQTMSTSSPSKFTHTYSVAGSYTVTLIVSDASGQSARATRVITAGKP